jgi:large subunit ribosomal protein L15
MHRSKGKTGGTGIGVGKFKHMKSRLMVMKRDGFTERQWTIGKHGFVVAPEIAKRKAINAINIKKLDEVVDQWVAAGKVEKKGSTYVVNLDKLNYQKLIGRGEVKKSYDITVKYASEGVQEKLKEAKSKLTLLAKADE